MLYQLSYVGLILERQTYGFSLKGSLFPERSASTSRKALVRHDFY